jgi:prephenate dehydrogenase
MAARDVSEFGDIGIIGIGRFGSYFAGQLERVGHRVHRADALDAPSGRDRALAQACGSSTVIYAVPIRGLERAIVETRELLAPGALVLDVSSVKVIPCTLLERLLPGVATVGTHPLFGQQSAPVSCAGQRVAVCQIAGAAGSAAAADRVERLFATLDLEIIRCTPAEHDAQVARTQFLTHFIGRGAIRAGVGRLPLSTKSHDALMDIVEVVGKDSIELFEDMAVFNPMVRGVRAEFLAALRAIDEQLSAREQAAAPQR